MVRSTRKITSASVFAPSPPLSAPDCERDGNLQHDSPHPADHQAGTGSSPSSFDSTKACAPIAASFPGKEEEVIQTTEQPPDDIPGRDGDDLETAISLIEASRQGRRLPDSLLSPEWHVLHVQPITYSGLCQLLEERDPELLAYFEEKIRCDYDPSRASLILRLMATTIHDLFQDELHNHIRRWLEDLAVKDAENPILGCLASDIRSKGHARLDLDSAAGEAWRSPDGQLIFSSTSSAADRPYQFKGSKFPQFVSEIGYTEKALALEGLAQAYYEDSNGRVKTVLTIDIKYASRKKRRAGSGDKSAVFCLYRGPDRIHANVAFRDANGSPVAGSCLRLFLSDFIPDAVLEQLSRGDKRRVRRCAVDMPSDLLCQFLDQAERQQRIDDDTEADSESEPGSGPSRKRKTVHWSRLHTDDDNKPTVSASTSASEDPEDVRSSSRSKRRKIIGAPDKEDTIYRSSRSHSCNHGHSVPGMQTRSMSRGRKEV